MFAAETNEDIEKVGKDNYPMFFEEDSEEEKEDYTIRENDHLIVAGKMVNYQFFTSSSTAYKPIVYSDLL